MNVASPAVPKTPSSFKETLKVIKHYHPMMNNKLFGNQILFPISSLDIVHLISFLFFQKKHEIICLLSPQSHQNYE